MARSAAQTQVALAAERDPRDGSTVIQQELFNTWYAAGGDLTMVYDGPYDNWTPYNQYSVLEVAQAGQLRPLSAEISGSYRPEHRPARDDPSQRRTTIAATRAIVDSADR